MAPKQISDRLSVSPQLSPADIDAAAVKGFRMIVNNRPDGEEAGQPTSAELASRADAAGLGYRHIPVVGGSIGDSDVAARSEEHTSELQSLMRISYAVFCLKKKKKNT